MIQYRITPSPSERGKKQMKSNSIENSPFSLSGGMKKNKLFQMLSGSLENVLSLKRCGRLYSRLSEINEPYPFLRSVLSELNITVKTPDAQKAMIPDKGPAIVVANHPFGAIEGIILSELLCSVRSDVKVMANFLLERIPQLQDLFISVDVFNKKNSVRANIRPIRDAIRWVEEGHMLVVFPAGEVSHIKMARREISDPEWNPGVAKIVSRTRAPVLPVFFKGANGPFFQLAGLLHPGFRTAMLPRELLNKREKCIELKIGGLISYERIKRFEKDRDLIDYLRWRTYLLGQAGPYKRTGIKGSIKSLFMRQKPIIDPQPAEILQQEIDRLPAGQQLASSGDYGVWQADAEQIPWLLLELGRLREICFRAANEGTGEAVDLDPYDDHYQHIFIWNQKACKLVGAYRIGCTDTLLKRFGTSGMYTSTLFHGTRRFYDMIGPALELGRSFVRSEYQRSYAPLLLLWKGIGQFVVRNPRYRMLFGPVSISRDYSDLSRQLIASTLLKHSGAKELAAMVRPKTPPKMKPIRLPGADRTFAQRFCPDMEEVCSVIADIELEVKGIPVLLKHYLNLGGQLLSFNIDKNFGDSMDGLILVDLLRSDPKSLGRYFGRDGLESFYGFHRVREYQVSERYNEGFYNAG